MELLNNLIAVAKHTMKRKGGSKMMAMLWALNIIDDLATFAEVPRRLKKDVRRQLKLMGREDLATEQPVA